MGSPLQQFHNDRLHSLAARILFDRELNAHSRLNYFLVAGTYLRNVKEHIRAAFARNETESARVGKICIDDALLSHRNTPLVELPYVGRHLSIATLACF